MDLSRIILGEVDSFLHTVNIDNRKDILEAVQEKQEEAAQPSKFDKDIESLRNYVGESDFQTGLSIEITLHEMLTIVPRERRRVDAFNSLAKYLREMMGINLTVKPNRTMQ